MTNISQKITGNMVLLVPFTRDYGKKMHASELARLIKQPQRTVARKLEDLKKLNMLDYTRAGRNKYFFLDLNKSYPLIQMVECYKEINFLYHHSKIAFLLRELSADYPLILFGSYAKGLAKDHSDVDLIMIGRKSKKITEILKRYPFEVNIFYFTLTGFKKLVNKKEHLGVEIVKDHIIFGDKEEIIKLFMGNYAK
ncbi:hypothetical protein HOE37_03750 [Candidatus Woesearchaeota archaeon]|jgi:predicted nucleotidyltransferase|nr:hypothetical protein [Candidatus Woesearchaeota archaeon]MBT4110945.1 hypothetical protein [Candidatus Woesearchaeota archaeon]MBT4336543.1 hypothetical protein [Candidatus Woesearchaeota archaeon]MBT4469708.1 hypothetical protein [Candidatus Woesearchaeota archaeon]MBT6744070.1 hypothetical protein [Candidatus Woesearchaeota archaeon]